MDFKDRFKGRTSTVTKDGVIDNLNAPSTNPVQKSFSNNQLSARSKAPTPLSYNDNQRKICNTRLFINTFIVADDRYERHFDSSQI